MTWPTCWRRAHPIDAHPFTARSMLTAIDWSSPERLTRTTWASWTDSSAQLDPRDHRAAPPVPPARQLSDDELAVERYRYLLRTAPPESDRGGARRGVREAHARSSARPSIASLAEQTPAGERLVSDEPSALARAATRAELRSPGSMERAFNGADASRRPRPAGRPVDRRHDRRARCSAPSPVSSSVRRSRRRSCPTPRRSRPAVTACRRRRGDGGRCRCGRRLDALRCRLRRRLRGRRLRRRRFRRLRWRRLRSASGRSRSSRDDGGSG